MKTRVLAVILVVMVLSILFVGGQQVQAQVPSGVVSLLAVDNLFEAINAGDMDLALESFASGATAEIVGMLESWQREGRQFRVLQDRVTNVVADMDIVTSDVEISDRGIAWGQQTIVSVTYNDQIQKLYTTNIKLTPWQYW